MEQKTEKEAIDSLLQKFDGLYRPQSELEKLKKAIDLASKLHSDQKRKSGEPYIIHPLAVAEILIDLGCDTETITAGILHDLLEDTILDVIQLEEMFGMEVAKLVEGVTKLGKLSFVSNQVHQAENFRKMLLAIAIDIRVVLVKISDRLHNMRTLEHLAPEKQRRIAQETLDIFAPLANRFGLNKAKNELEDLSFMYLDKEEYKAVENLVIGDKEYREKKIKELIYKIKTELEKTGIKANIYGRPKHFYSIFRKAKRLGSEDIHDLLGIRIIVERERQCYEVMGIIHDLFRPIPGKFKDYIAIPKPNMYQSLHTAIVGPHGRPVEIQIRTEEMHQIAEFGIAAHWKYKESGNPSKADDLYDEKISWVRKLIEWQGELKDPEEYLDAVKLDLFSDEVFILTPKGDVIDFPRNATPVDFAFRIHTDIGTKCTGAIVNGRMVPIDTVLKNGDIVEIMTSKNAKPSLDWLNFVVTNSAKNKIRQWFKKQNRDQHIEQGKKLIEDLLGEENYSKILASNEFRQVIQELNRASKEDLLASVGCGDITVPQLKTKLRGMLPGEGEDEKKLKFKTQGKIEDEVSELDGMLHHIAKCCSPLPGEDIVGVVSKGRGIAVHRYDCRNLEMVEDDRIMHINWRGNKSKRYSAGIEVECFDRVGVSRDILNKIADENINVRDLRVIGKATADTTVMKIVVEIGDVYELKTIMSAINRIGDVVNVFRSGEHKRISIFRKMKKEQNNF